MAEISAKLSIDGCNFVKDVIQRYMDNVEFNEDVPEEYKKGFYGFGKAVVNVLNENFVPHGRWEEADDGDGAVCSVCREDFCNVYLETDRFKYCPNCGARMDGDT